MRLKCPSCGAEHRVAVPENSSPSPLAPSSSTKPGADQASHRDEAQRFARLILQEIVLYNEKRLEKMTRKREVLIELRGDLIKGKRHYFSRIPPEVAGREEIFNQQVREVLLSGKE